MKICEYVSEIERIVILHNELQKDIENFKNLASDIQITTFYNLLFINKFDHIFPISYIETNGKWYSSTEVINSLYRHTISFIIAYKGYDITVKYQAQKEGIFFNCDGVYEELTIKNSIDFKKDNLKEMIEQKYQLILNKFEEMIQKDKMLKDNINFMKKMIKGEV